MKRRHPRPIPRHNLRAMPPGCETLERLVRWPALQRRLRVAAVHIYSGEHQSYWRPYANGYTTDPAQRGTWTLEKALKLTSHCGSDKRIEFHSLPE